MKHGSRGGRESFRLVASAALVLAWTLTFFSFFVISDWNLLFDGGDPAAFSLQNRMLFLGGAMVLAGLVLAWLFYSLGLQELRKQAEVERKFRWALEEAYRGTLYALTSVLDLRDDETYGHSRRVMGYSLAIGARLGLDKSDLQTLAWGALLHDLGKIGIRDEILLKPGPLTPEEEAAIRQHVVIGSQLVKSVPFLSRAAPIIRHHHERYDGTGYPDRLKGEEIPLLARIFAVADAYDAMTSPRPYRPAPMSMARAREVLAGEKGRQFCPRAVEAFLQIPLSELEEIRARSFLPMDDLSTLVSLDVELESLLPQYYRDSLTGAQNREAWEAKKAQMAMFRGLALGTVVFLDMDGLKQVNDTFGHMTGDRVLADLGARLGQVAREVYRVGGDEFVLWFPMGEWNEATERKLVETLANFTAYWQNLLAGVSVSWGVSTATPETTSLTQLLAEADRAMYSRKGASRAAAG
nr:MAG: hypothetical protein DIU70_02595 [Bacillota bacterium]